MTITINQLNTWLSEFQLDLLKIVNKYRYDKHVLSSEDIVSEINIALLKKINQENFAVDAKIENVINFKKMAYSYARNYIAWTADGASNRDKRYISSRQDGVVKSEDGDVTVFESICSTVGKEDIFFQQLNSSDKFQNILSWIFDYSHFLTPHHKNILELMLSGRTLDEVGDLTGVTHQAISAISLDMFELIKSNVNIKLNDEDSDKLKIKKGNEAINYLFGPSRSTKTFLEQDIEKITKALKNNPNKYSLIDLSKLCNKKYTSKQICAFVNSTKVNNLLKKKTVK